MDADILQLRVAMRTPGGTCTTQAHSCRRLTFTAQNAGETVTAQAKVAWTTEVEIVDATAGVETWSSTDAQQLSYPKQLPATLSLVTDGASKVWHPACSTAPFDVLKVYKICIAGICLLATSREDLISAVATAGRHYGL